MSRPILPTRLRNCKRSLIRFDFALPFILSVATTKSKNTQDRFLCPSALHLSDNPLNPPYQGDGSEPFLLSPLIRGARGVGGKRRPLLTVGKNLPPIGQLALLVATNYTAGSEFSEVKINNYHR